MGTGAVTEESRRSWAEILDEVGRISVDDPDPRRRARASDLWFKMTRGSGSAAAISVGSGVVIYDTPKPTGAGWAEHNAIEDGDG